MNSRKSSILKKGTEVALILIMWMVIAWLLYPLIVLDTVDMLNAKEYLYRAALGVVIMIILFGKTIFDLLFPQTVSQKKSVLNVTFLTLYSLILAGGIFFMVARIVVMFIKSSDTEIPFY